MYLAGGAYIAQGKAVWDGYFGRQENIDKALADKRISAEQHRQITQRRRRDDNIRSLNEAYGIGDSEIAQKNKGGIAQSLQSYYDNILQSGMDEADSNFSQTSKKTRQNIARAGQAGGSIDAQAQSGGLADYMRGRNQAISRARDARTGIQTGLDNQRMSHERAIQGNPSANPNFSSVALERESILNQARGQIAPAAIGNLLRVAGDTYTNGVAQGANGNQGLDAFTSTSGNGRSTGR